MDVGKTAIRAANGVSRCRNRLTDVNKIFLFYDEIVIVPRS